eukprot:754542-Hanusia_phi.AAC.1
MRFDQLYHILAQRGHAPGNLTNNGNVRGRMNKVNAGNAWVMEIGITAMDRVRVPSRHRCVVQTVRLICPLGLTQITKIDLVFGCLFHEMPELTNCLVDDYFISALLSMGRTPKISILVDWRVGADNRTCYLIASRVRQRACHAYGVRYMSTNGKNRWCRSLNLFSMCQ